VGNELAQGVPQNTAWQPARLPGWAPCVEQALHAAGGGPSRDEVGRHTQAPLRLQRLQDGLPQQVPVRAVGGGHGRGRLRLAQRRS
jgi:hypothetical protein